MTVFRYNYKHFDFRKNFIKIAAFLQRKNVLFVDDDLVLCKKVLENSSLKGSFIERLIALPAWEPVFSVESVDGDRWRDLSFVFKKIFARFLRYSQYEQITKEYISQFVSKCLYENKKIDGKACSTLVASIFFQCLFGRKLTLVEEKLYYQASLEWRKEIAVKGKGCVKTKSQFVEHVLNELKQSTLFEGITKNQLDLVSAIAQPFLLSPQINFSDILATLFLNLHKDRALFYSLKSLSLENKDITSFILESIRIAHPFPILEREITKCLLYKDSKLEVGTQVFLMLDQFDHSDEFNVEKWANPEKSLYSVFAFGAGERVCPGRKVALNILSTIVQEFIKQIPIENIVPYENHHYSGRMNDRKESIKSNLYQLKIFMEVIWRSLKIGLAK